ncbi:MAG: hypothetical protein GX660_05075 [Clostridiaceae bacterium]|nr:hypothetical protein [Clostridiaceae bacterium]
MAKRIRYKIGDIFLVPLENDLNGVGRVLKNDQATIFIELYKIKPIRDVSEFDFEEAIKNKPLVMKWCYDDGVRKGEWTIFDNKPVDEEIDMPYFWSQDCGNWKYFIRKGTSDSFDTAGERIEISKEDIDKYEPYGIGNEISERNRYMRRLKQAGLL